MSAWDKLGKEFDEALSMQEYVVPKSLMDRWSKVKAEGDKLQEKADELQESYIELHGMAQEWGQKLEAVKTYIAKLQDQAKKTDDIFERGFCKGIADNLEKILEVKG